MDERLVRLERQLDDVVSRLRRLEERLAALEESREETALPPVSAGAEAVAALARPDVPSLINHLGRSVLILGGAFLIRAITDSGALATSAGIALGFAYAVFWLLLADRAGRGGDIAGACFSGVASLFIAFPLLWEATFKFQVLGPAAGATALTLVTVLALVVAWRADAQVLAWAATLGSIAVAVSMLVVSHRVVGFTSALLVLGLATLWLAYARRWHGVRWPAAVAVDLMVLQATVLAARAGGPTAPYDTLSLPAVIALSIALVITYLGSFTARILSRRRNITIFEAIQSLAVLAVGVGGAGRVIAAAGWSPVSLGVGVLVLAAGAYATAFVFVERRDGQGLSFQFFASIALLLALTGSTHALSDTWSTALWCALALTAAALAARFDRMTLRVHAALYLVAAGVLSGFVGWSADTLLAPAVMDWPELRLGGVMTLLAAIAAYPLLAAGYRVAPPRWYQRLPALTTALLGALGLAGLGVTTVTALLGQEGSGLEAGLLATTRTALLAVAAVAFAVTHRTGRFAELRWLVYPVLVGLGVKLLLEDLVRGHAATLFPSLACYGIALILAPRLLRRQGEPDR